MLDRAASLSEADEIRSQRDAILTSRLLLDDPDPVAPLIIQLSSVLRTALTKALDQVRSAYQDEVTALASSEGWNLLNEDQQRSVLQRAGLVIPESPNVGSDDQLLAALGAQPLGSLQERIDALPAKAVAALKAIAEIVDPEPKVTVVKATSVTLKSESDVNEYLAALRAQLMQYIAAGGIVIT